MHSISNIFGRVGRGCRVAIGLLVTTLKVATFEVVLFEQYTQVLKARHLLRRIYQYSIIPLYSFKPHTSPKSVEQDIFFFS